MSVNIIKPNKQRILDIVSTLTSQVPVENLLFSSNYRAEIGVFSVGKQWPSFMQTMQWDANLRKGSRHLLPPTFKTMSATFSCPKLPFNIAVFYCSAQTNPNKSNRTKVHQNLDLICRSNKQTNNFKSIRCEAQIYQTNNFTLIYQ